MKRDRVKRLGQHFLKNPGVLKKILDNISPKKDDLIIEIGAGKGALTFSIAERAGKVIAVEKDKSLIPFLMEKNISNLKVLEQDILKTDFRELIKKELDFKGRVKLVGNLPYSISSPLLFKVYKDKEMFHECIFLLKKEVAERLCAGPGTKKFAPISIIFQNHFMVRLCFVVNPASFSPPPRVKSALVFLKKREHPLFYIRDEDMFRKFLRSAFLHRRKTLFNNLVMVGYCDFMLRKAFRNLELQKYIRAEQLPISTFVHLYDFLLENME